MKEIIQYKGGYKYQLTVDYSLIVPIRLDMPILSRFIDLTPDGWLTIKAGYAWDGPSGPTIDTKNFMRGSLVHDALYQLMREGLLPESYRNVADVQLRNICLVDGMSTVRAWGVYQAVRLFGAKNARPEFQGTT